MKIMFLCAKDMAGTMYNLCAAVNKYTKHEAEQMVTRQGRYKYPIMHRIGDGNRKEMLQRIYDSDAIVFHEWLGIPHVMKMDTSKIRNKILAISYGGGGFRNSKKRQNGRDYYRKISENVIYFACSADFLIHENIPWVPRCVRTEELRQTYDYTKLDPPVIAVSPSKGSDNVKRSMGLVSENFREIAKSMKQRDFKFQARHISNYKKTISNDACLRLKAPASIFFDRLYSIYGVNSLEAGAFGSAVVTGTAPHALSGIRKRLGIPCPYVIVDNWEQTQAEIENLLNNPKELKQRGLKCYEYSKRVEEHAAKRLVEILGG